MTSYEWHIDKSLKNHIVILNYYILTYLKADPYICTCTV